MIEKRLALTGALVTIALRHAQGEAMGTQRAIAETIRKGGGDYLLSLKENWPATFPATFKDVAAFFTDPPPGALDTSNRKAPCRMRCGQYCRW
jgi:hypothetical protein